MADEVRTLSRLELGEVERKVSAWQDRHYHHAHKRNPERRLIVHSDRVTANVQDVTDQVIPERLTLELGARLEKRDVYETFYKPTS